MGVLVIGSLAVLVGTGSLLADRSFASIHVVDSSAAGIHPTGVGRDALTWPFTNDSIWNLPIGASASYVPAKILRSTAYGFVPDEDVIVMSPKAPVTSVYYNGDEWSGRSRCNAQGGVLFDAPIPTDFVIPGAHPGWTPNYATVFLLPDGHTLAQGQPSARCTPNGTATMWWYQTNEDLYGTGLSGAHGGSMLSSLGGTIRLGELVPGGAIRHTLKVNLDGTNYYYDTITHGYRWPALASDGCAPGCYTGTNPALRMGSLLALPASMDISNMGLETEPGKILAKAFQDYGGYTVDNAGWSVYNIATEFGPYGRVQDEFANRWGFPIDPASKDVPWSRDMDRIFLNLSVVDNWDQVKWLTVSASKGALGVALGAPRVPWAPGFEIDSTPPVITGTSSGTSGSSGWYRSAVTVTLNASDSGSGVASIKYRIDGGAWQTYPAPLTVSADGSHTVDFYAVDFAGNQSPTQSLTFKIDATAPQATATLSGTLGSGGWYRSAVAVTLSATDGTSGVASLRFRTDGGVWSDYTAPVSVSGDGSHTADYYAVDVAGNQAATGTTTFKIDTVAPVTVSTLTGTLGTSGWYVSFVTATLTATTPNGSTPDVAYRLDAGTWATYTGPLSVADGRHVLEFRADDGNGHIEPVKSVAINVDSTMPTVLRGAGTDVIRPDGSIAWVGSDGLSGIARYEVSIDGGPFVSVGTQTSLSQNWSMGDHYARIRAYDNAGNVATSTIPFTVQAGGAPTGGWQLFWISVGDSGTLFLFIFALFSIAGGAGFMLGRSKPRSRSVRAEPLEDESSEEEPEPDIPSEEPVDEEWDEI